MAPSLAEVRFLLFDVMGTVVDVDETARRTAVRAPGPHLIEDKALAVVEEWNRAIGAQTGDVVAGVAPGRHTGNCAQRPYTPP